MGALVKTLSLLGEESLQTYLTVSLYLAPVLALLALVLRRKANVHELTNVPLAGVTMPGYIGLLDARQRYITSSRQMLKEAYYKYRNKSFVMPTNNEDRIILTAAQVHELASAPDELVDSRAGLERTMLGKYTGTNRLKGTGYLGDVIRTKLTRNLGRLKEPMIDEIRFAFGTELPPCDDWTSIHIHPKILRIVARVSARVFVGFPLCRDEDWLKTSILYTVDYFKTVAELRAVPWFFRPFKAFFRRSSSLIGKHRKIATECLTPTINARLVEEEADIKAGRPPKEYGDMLQWLTDTVRPEHRTADAIAELQLGASMAAIHSTALTFTTIVIGLASHPEYIPLLREEIEEVIKEDGGAVQKTTLRKMRKMDSFIRESLRGRMGIFAFTRKVMKSFTLSDGTFLPKGAILVAPRMMFDLDPELSEDPEVFDGLRSYKKHLECQGASQFDKSQCVTTSPSYLTFSHGRHACPGRFFATDELKLLIVHLLLNYDVKFGEGNPRLPDSSGESNIPDLAQKISFKKIQAPKGFDFL